MGTYRDSLIAAMVVFLVINTLAIGARLYVRIKLLTRAIGLDDLMLCITFVSVSLPLPLFRLPLRKLGWIPGHWSEWAWLTQIPQSGYVIHCGLESASMYWGYAAPDGEKLSRYNNARATDVSSKRTHS